MYKRTGIIDIGSNSIRLVIYETSPTNGYRVIDESKETARLSERIGEDGVLHDPDIQLVADIINRFKMICSSHHVHDITAIATAAIRNASNQHHIMTKLKQTTSLDIQMLTGSEEAGYGFIGTINTINQSRGYVIDIGGGSTEITWFSERRLKFSISLPYGAVNTMKLCQSEQLEGEQARSRIVSLIQNALQECDWIGSHPGEVMIGMGGTIRAVCKMLQRQKQYSFHQTHHYVITPSEITKLFQLLSTMTVQQRKQVDGLSKDRADTIIYGMTILRTVIETTDSPSLIVSGAGLRDGIYYSTIMTEQEQPIVADVLEHSLLNMLRLHAYASLSHVHQVNRYAIQLFDTLQHRLPKLDRHWRTCLHVASMLYRIGVTVNYYNFEQHTFYMIAHSRLNGLDHRDLLLSALIASYKSKHRTKQLMRQHPDLLRSEDLETIVQLGEVLQLAIALDRSETQPISELAIDIDRQHLRLTAQTDRSCSVEYRAVELVKKDFRKIWGLELHLQIVFP